MEFGWRKTLLYSLIPVVALLAVLEGGARLVELWIPPLSVDYGWGFNPESRLYVTSKDDPSLMVTDPAKRASFCDEQFSVPKPDATFRVFMLGGSSVNYIQSDLAQMVQRLAPAFGGKYRFEVIDAGGCAYGTHRLVPLLVEVLNYESDLILVYSGHNEFEEADQLVLARPERAALQRAVYASALLRVVRDSIARVQMARMLSAKEKAMREHNNQILANPEADYMSGFHYDYTPEEIAGRMATYRDNLSLMVQLCKERGVPIILGTVPSNLWQPDLMKDEDELEVRRLYDAGKYEEGAALARGLLRESKRHQASDEENAIIRAVAEQHEVPLADVEQAIIGAEPHGIPGETLFSDRCHLDGDGNAILTATYEKVIRRVVQGIADAERDAL